MGNTNQGTSQASGGERSKQRRPSTSEPLGPLEVPLGAHRYNIETTPPNSQAVFGQILAEQVSLPDADQEFVKQSLHTDSVFTPETARRNQASLSKTDNHRSANVPKNVPAVIKWDKGGHNVSVSGSFNNWERKIPLVKSEKNFYTIIDVPEGEHEYKFYIDGQWCHNPSEPTKKTKTGHLNNLLKVSKADYEFWQALETDREATIESRKDNEQSELSKKTSAQPDEESIPYGQEIPVRRPTDRHVIPPVLPPHLLQVILNKDVSDHLEPGLLPEPNHVMLNHLYALSIKDGVMVLSDTSRYKKKYVTTLLYKPIDS